MMKILDEVWHRNAAIRGFAEYEVVGTTIASQPILAKTADQRIIAATAAENIAAGSPPIQLSQ